MRELTINVMAAYFKAKMSSKYRFTAELLQAIGKETGLPVDTVEFIINANT